MENKKPFVFGGISSNTPLPNEKPKKPKRIKIIKKHKPEASDAFYCDERIKDKTVLCRNEKCVCKYKNTALKIFIWK
jgi:hypothetical protein